MILVLTGLPGSGKTTVGRQLARRLSFSFVDSDQVIEQRLGCSIGHYFEQHGENAFRDCESLVLAELVGRRACPHAKTGPASTTGCQGQVLSTGGGAVLRAANRDLLRASGVVFYLSASPEEIYKRIRHDRKRPLLQVADPLGRLRQLHAERAALYRETAHFVIEMGRPTPGMLVSRIIAQLELSGLLPQPGGE